VGEGERRLKLRVARPPAPARRLSKSPHCRVRRHRAGRRRHSRLRAGDRPRKRPRGECSKSALLTPLFPIASPSFLVRRSGDLGRDAP
jgi:hypothetical protein